MIAVLLSNAAILRALLMVSRWFGTQELGGLPEARPEDGTFVNKAEDGTTDGIPPATYKFRLYGGKVGHT